MLQVNPVEAKLAKWTRCNLSGEPLHPPCVADELGNLYNKDTMVQALVSKSLPGSLSYISSLKHLIDLRCLATLHVHEPCLHPFSFCIDQTACKAWSESVKCPVISVYGSS